MLCASCLAKLAKKETKMPLWWTWAPRVALAFVAVAVVYFTLLLLGNILLSFPSHFHTRGGW